MTRDMSTKSSKRLSRPGSTHHPMFIRGWSRPSTSSKERSNSNSTNRRYEPERELSSECRPVSHTPSRIPRACGAKLLQVHTGGALEAMFEEPARAFPGGTPIDRERMGAIMHRYDQIPAAPHVTTP